MQQLEDRTLFSGSGLAGAYFARTNLTLNKFARVDAAVDFSWNGGTPARSLGTDGFSVRWVGSVLAKFSESHTFFVSGTGGFRLWVGGHLLIDNSDQSQHEDSGSLRLSAGRKYAVRLEYVSNGNDPSVKLEWQSARTPRQDVPTNRLYPNKLDATAPSQPSNFSAVSAGNGSVQLSWDASSDPSGVVDYDVYIGSSKVASLLASQTTYLASGRSGLTSDTFQVVALDAAGHNSSAAQTAVAGVSPGGQSQPPSTPAGLQVTGTTSDSVSIQWNASNDSNGSITGYRIYRNGTKLNLAVHGTSFTDTGLSAGTQYTYAVRAADDSGLFSPVSRAVAATTNSDSTSSGHDAYAGIDATSFDGSSGVNSSGSVINSLDDGDWVVYRNVDFGSGANSAQLNLALDPNNVGGSIEVRIDSANGQLVGTHRVQPTGDSNTFYNQGLDISTVSGTHDLYLVFRGRSDVAQLKSISFDTRHLTRIMALGDSITQAFIGTPSYRWYLWQLLQQAGYPTDFVGSQIAATNGTPPNLNFDQNHEGHSGWNSGDIANNIAGWAAEFKPDIVLLHAGSNDAEEGLSVDYTMGNLTTIVNALRAANPNVKIIMAQLIPDSINMSGIDDINSQVPSLAASLTTSRSPITVVDMHSDFSLNDTFDGVHLTSSGESKMAQHWFDALAPMLQ